MTSEEAPPHDVWAQRELFLPVRRDHAGRSGPTPWAARGPLWRSSSRGYFVPSAVPRSPDQRILEASVLLPAYGGVTGWAGLRWRRRPWFDGTSSTGLERPVTLVTAGNHIRPQPGVAVSHERLDPVDLTVIDGVRLTTEVRSVWYEMRYAENLRAAASILSMAAYSDGVSIDELAAFAALHRGWTGAPLCRRAIGLAEENVWSPMELEVAMVWTEAELPRLLCNQPLFDRSGRHIATPDLLDVEARVAIDFDGPRHLGRAQRARDVIRTEVYRRHGLEHLVVLGPHLADRPALARRMHEVRGRAAFEPLASRSWTVDHPPWWVPTHTVALRRALRDDQRPRCLGYRIAA